MAPGENAAPTKHHNSPRLSLGFHSPEDKASQAAEQKKARLLNGGNGQSLGVALWRRGVSKVNLVNRYGSLGLYSVSVCLKLTQVTTLFLSVRLELTLLWCTTGCP